MAREREISCEDHSFTTRANPRVFVRCPTCGRGHRAPPIAHPWPGPTPKTGTSEESHDAVDAVAELAGEVLPPPASTVIKVTRAAHSTARKAEKATAKSRGKSAKSAKSTKSTKRPAAELTPSQRAGRRGGLAPKKPAFLRRVGR